MTRSVVVDHDGGHQGGHDERGHEDELPQLVYRIGVADYRRYQTPEEIDPRRQPPIIGLEVMPDRDHRGQHAGQRTQRGPGLSPQELLYGAPDEEQRHAQEGENTNPPLDIFHHKTSVRGIYHTYTVNANTPENRGV